MSKVIDYAWSGPSAAQIKAMGFEGVMRYLSHDGSKNLSPAERDALRAQGLSIGLVWESTSNRAEQGYTAGVADATSANAQADGLGYPLSCAIYAAVDYDADPSHITAYFGGWLAQSPRPPGAYGSFRVIEALVPQVPFGWQTVAWSGGKVSSKAQLLQNGFSGSYDTNQVLKANYGQWTTTPTQPVPQEDDMTPDQAKQLNDLHDLFFSPQGMAPDVPNGHDTFIELLRRMKNTESATLAIKNKTGA